MTNEAHRITNQHMIVKPKHIQEETWKTGETNMTDIQKLREITKASISDCKSALENSKSLDKAIEWLKKKGIVDGLRLQGEAKEGLITSYIHGNGKVGVLLDVGCQTDFVARTDEFKTFCRDVALHIVGHDPYPRFINEESLKGDCSLYDEQFSLIMNKTLIEKGFAEDVNRDTIPSKQWDMISKIVVGRISKWKNDICLLTQKFVKDPTITIQDLMAIVSGLTKEKIVIRQFTRYAI